MADYGYDCPEPGCGIRATGFVDVDQAAAFGDYHQAQAHPTCGHGTVFGPCPLSPDHDGPHTGYDAGSERQRLARTQEWLERFQGEAAREALRAGELGQRVVELERENSALTARVELLSENVQYRVKSANELDHEVTRLQRERGEADQLNGRLAAILNATANALRGGPPADGLWSFDDLPERAAALREVTRRRS